MEKLQAVAPSVGAVERVEWTDYVSLFVVGVTCIVENDDYNHGAILSLL